ncbi:MAG: Biopolymer transport protein ExbB [Pseudomonadota bacterium]
MTFFNWTTLQIRSRRAAQAVACALIVMVASTGLTPSIVYAQANTAQPAATAAPAAAPAAAAEPARAENPYGLKALWNEGDFVSKITLLILVIMSIGSWYVIFTKYREQGKVIAFKKESDETFWSASSVQAGHNTLNEDSPFRYVAEKGLASVGHHKGLIGMIDLNSWLTMSIQRAVAVIQSRLQGGLAFLATVGSTAPFVGLFGTVWGIYNALVKIGISGQASIDKVAGPVGEALIMTAIGLAVAVPAVLGYNWLVRRNKQVMEGVNGFANELHAVILAESRK